MSSERELLVPLFSGLLDLLTAEDPDLRREALIALSRLRGQVAADILFERFQSDNIEEYIALALTEIDPDRAARALIQALGDAHLEVRVHAARALATRPTEAAIYVLTSAVENYLHTLQGSGDRKKLLSPEAMSAAVQALGIIGTPICLSLLQKLVMQERDPRLRACALSAWGPHVQDAYIPLLQGVLKDSDARVRANAIEALQNSEKPTIIGILQPYLYDAHQRVRANAVKAIWRFGDFEVSMTLKEMLGDSDKKQRISALYAVGEIKLKTFRRQVVESLKDGDPDVRRNAVIATRKLGEREFLVDLTPLLRDPVPEVREQVIHAMIAIGEQRVAKALLQALKHEESPLVRLAIIDGLGKVKAVDAIDMIVRCLDDDDDRLVLAAIECLLRLRPEALRQPWSRPSGDS
jgi:HEAT repeat protein